MSRVRREALIAKLAAWQPPAIADRSPAGARAAAEQP